MSRRSYHRWRRMAVLVGVSVVLAYLQWNISRSELLSLRRKDTAGRGRAGTGTVRTAEGDADSRVSASARNAVSNNATARTASGSVSLSLDGLYRPDSKLTVFLDARGDDAPMHGYSVFLAGTVQRYGNGTLRYVVRRTNMARETFQTALAPATDAPCLLASRDPSLDEIRNRFAPWCRTLLVYDEFCKGVNRSGIDLREYYFPYPTTANASSWPAAIRGTVTNGTAESAGDVSHRLTTEQSPLYVPLGPRHDFWHAYQQHFADVSLRLNDSDAAVAVDNARLVRSSNRRTVFNAMFSNPTSRTRERLKTVLLNGTIPRDILRRSHIKIAKWWTKTLNNGHEQPGDYVSIMLDSVYTLSPLGHNPECFRLFEAMEAGSIPIVALEDSYYQHRCRDSLFPFLDNTAPYGAAPVIVLSDWTNLTHVIQELVNRDPADVDRQQEQMLRWYYSFMSDWASRFELLLRTPRLTNGTI